MDSYLCSLAAGLWWVPPVLGVLVVAVLAVNALMGAHSGCAPLIWQRLPRR